MGDIGGVPPFDLKKPNVMRVWAACPFTDATAKLSAGQIVMWAVGVAHPFVQGFQILRMYLVEGGAVEVYSFNPKDQKEPLGLRHTLLPHVIALVEEAMEPSVMSDQLMQAEEDEGDDPDDPEPDPAVEPATNGALVPLTSSGGTG